MSFGHKIEVERSRFRDGRYRISASSTIQFVRFFFLNTKTNKIFRSQSCYQRQKTGLLHKIMYSNKPLSASNDVIIVIKHKSSRQALMCLLTLEKEEKSFAFYGHGALHLLLQQPNLWGLSDEVHYDCCL